jgi:hypothetical protein
MVWRLAQDVVNIKAMENTSANASSPGQLRQNSRRGTGNSQGGDLARTHAAAAFIELFGNKTCPARSELASRD